MTFRNSAVNGLPGLDHVTSAQPYGICTEKLLLAFFLLIVLVCKLLSIPVDPEWRDNQASHVAKGRSECTGDGPHLRKELRSKPTDAFLYLSTNEV